MSRVLKVAAALAAIFATNLALAHEFKIKDFEFIHPWTREPARGVKDVPVYMVLRNMASAPDRIVAVSSPFATSGELRAGKSEGERPVSAIPVPADATIELNADGPHILLLGLTEPLDGYQYFPLVLTFERAGQMELTAYNGGRNEGHSTRHRQYPRPRSCVACMGARRSAPPEMQEGLRPQR